MQSYDTQVMKDQTQSSHEMQLIPGASQTVNLQNQNEEQEMKDPTREENMEGQKPVE